MKVENLQSVEIAVYMIVRWMYGVSLKDRKCFVHYYESSECGWGGEVWQLEMVWASDV